MKENIAGGLPDSALDNDAVVKNRKQDQLNRITLERGFRNFIAGETDEATLDLLLKYPEIAKEWLMQASLRIHRFSRQTEIGVQTVFGRLSAGVSGDPIYPGIHVCIEQKDAEGRCEKQLALVECTPDHPRAGCYSLRLMVWNSDDQDNFTNDFTFIEGDAEPDESTAESSAADESNKLYATATYGRVFKIYEKGISVKLSYSGCIYSTHSTFFDTHPQFGKLKSRFAYNQPFPINTPLIVVGWGKHDIDTTAIYVLENPVNGLIYLCSAECAGYITVLSHKARYATREEALNQKTE